MTREDAYALIALRPALRSYFKRRNVDENDVDDLVSDTIESIVRAWFDFDPSRGPNALRRWVFGYARHVLSHYRRGARCTFVELRPEHAIAPGQDEQIEARDTLRFLSKRVQRAHWTVLIQRIEATATEVAAERGEPRSTVEWRTAKARAAMARAVTRETEK